MGNDKAPKPNNKPINKIWYVKDGTGYYHVSEGDGPNTNWRGRWKARESLYLFLKRWGLELTPQANMYLVEIKQVFWLELCQNILAILFT